VEAPAPLSLSVEELSPSSPCCGTYIYILNRDMFCGALEESLGEDGAVELSPLHGVLKSKGNPPVSPQAADFPVDYRGFRRGERGGLSRKRFFVV